MDSCSLFVAAAVAKGAEVKVQTVHHFSQEDKEVDVIPKSSYSSSSSWSISESSESDSDTCPDARIKCSPSLNRKNASPVSGPKRRVLPRRRRPSSRSNESSEPPPGPKRRHGPNDRRRAGQTSRKQSSPLIVKQEDGQSNPRNSGSPLTYLERLIRTHPIWFLPELTRDEAISLLMGKDDGCFIVRQSSQTGTMAMSVVQESSQSVEHYLIESVNGQVKLESSDNRFENILSLVYHYVSIKNDLPQLLTLPWTLKETESRQSLTSLALLGKDFWRYPMSFADHRRSTLSPTLGKAEPGNHLGMSRHDNPSAALLDETLCGLQEVSDMLQASLKELEMQQQTPIKVTPPAPPVRTSSHHASPVTSPGVRRRRCSETEVPPLPSGAHKSPKPRPRSSRHSVCRMVLTQVPEARFPPESPTRHRRSGCFSNNNNQTAVAPAPATTNCELSKQKAVEQGHCYYKSSVSDKMSDYEDIWGEAAIPASVANRSITPVESENQFKAYLAQKFHEQSEANPSKATDVSSSISFSSTCSSQVSVTSSKISSSASHTPTSSPSSSSSMDKRLDHSGAWSSSEVIDTVYSDPLDVLEKAVDTRIYCFPEQCDYDEEVAMKHSEPIYEEAPPLQEDNDINLVEELIEEEDHMEWKEVGQLSNSTKEASRPPMQTDRPASDAKSERKTSNPSTSKNTVISRDNSSSPKRENRLSAVIGRCIRPPSTAVFYTKINKKTNSWQVDSSSWEFLVQDDLGNTSSSLPLPKEHHKTAADRPLELKVEPLTLAPPQTSVQEATAPIIIAEDIGGNSCSKSSREKIQSYLKVLAQEESSLFGQSVSFFVACTKDSSESNPYVIMRNMRQFMSGLKNYLSRSGEGQFRELVNEERSLLRSDEFLNLDAILEEILQELVISPLQEHLSQKFLDDFQKSGCIQLLCQNMAMVREATVQISTDSSAAMTASANLLLMPIITEFPEIMTHIGQILQQCKDSFSLLRLTFSPADKLTHLLKAFKQIVHYMSTSQSNVNVEKFCCLLGIILSHTVSEEVEMESEYMWGLLPKPLLSSEAGYYLTLLSSSIHYLKTYHLHHQSPASPLVRSTSHEDPAGSSSPPTGASSTIDSKLSKKSVASSVLSNASSSLTNGVTSLESCNFIRVLIPNELNGSIAWKHLPIKTRMTAKEVTRIMANKLKMTNAEDYGLYHLKLGQEERIGDCSQMSELSCPDGIFVYRRRDANIVWPPQLLEAESSG